MTFLLKKSCDEILIFIKELGIAWHTFDFTPKGPKGREIHLGWPYFTNREQKTAGHFLGLDFLEIPRLSQRFCRKWTPLPGSQLKPETQYPLFGFLGPFRVRIFPNPRLRLLKSMKDHIEQTKYPSHKSHYNPCEMLYFWHTLLHCFCFNNLSLSVKLQYSNWMSLAVRGDVENEANFC